MLFRQTLFTKTFKFFISVMDFKEIRQTLLVQIDFDFLANSPNFNHAKLSSFMVLQYAIIMNELIFLPSIIKVELIDTLFF